METYYVDVSRPVMLYFITGCSIFTILVFFYSDYQGNRITDNIGYEKWLSERTKLRGDLDRFGLSNSWLKSKMRTPLEGDLLHREHLNRYEVSSTFA